MEIFIISGLVNGIVGTVIGTAVWLQNRRESANLTFTLLAFSIAIWSFGYWRWLSSVDYYNALFWVKIFTVGSILIPICYFWWVTTFVGLVKKFKLLIFCLLSVSALLNILLYTTDLLVKGMEPRLVFSFWPVPGTYYFFYILFIYIGLVVLSLIILFNNLAYTNDPVRRSQIKFITWGSVIGFGGGGTNFFLWYNIPIPPYINFTVTIGLFLFGYAAIKHRLFNIRVIAAELLIFVIWIFLLTQTLLVETLRQQIINGLLLIWVIGFGILLVRSVLNEVKQKEEIEKLAQSLTEANKELKKLDELKSNFVSIASHQLRSPLTLMKGYLSLALEGSFGPMTDQLKEKISTIYKSNERLIRLVNDLLNISRIERGKMEYKFKTINLAPFLRDIVDYFKVKAGNLELRAEIPDNLPPIKGDEDKLHEVFANLVDNALHYTPSGSITVQAHQAHSNAGSVLISVRDTGVGIDPEDLPHLFSQFTRGADISRLYTEGAGLGLYVARKIVEDHGGKIWVESAGKGKGSTFFVELPIASET